MIQILNEIKNNLNLETEDINDHSKKPRSSFKFLKTTSETSIKASSIHSKLGGKRSCPRSRNNLV